MRTESWRAAAGLTLVLVAQAAAQPSVRAAQSVQPSPEAGLSRQAQPATPQPGTQTPVGVTMTAEQVRTELRQLLRQYPPSVADTLRLSPSLTTDSAYLSSYPALSAFLAAHPEIPRSPSFYLGAARVEWANDSESVRRVQEVSEMFASFGLFVGLMTLLGVVGWLLRSIIHHQRWKRALKVQADAHAKLLERCSSTEDVLAYAQSPAGRHFLQSGAPLETVSQAVSAPINRILWSVQVGTVFTMLGLGLYLCSATTAPGSSLGADPGFAATSPFFYMLGTVTAAAGVGFLLSSLISYALSKRLGLLAPAPPESSHA
jgi:hypothetical protein